MRTLLATLLLLAFGKPCWCQNAKDIDFLKKIYAISQHYWITNDRVDSLTGNPVSGDSIDEFVFFTSNIETKKDTIKINAHIASLYKMISPINEKEEFVFTGCRPEIYMTKVDKDSCWRGLYASEGTGLCNATMTVHNGELRIAMTGKNEAFVCYIHYKAVTPPKEVAAAINEYLKR